MTIEQQESLTRELDGAMKSGDPKRICSAQSNILLAVMDCQRKTSERVKRLGWKFTVLLTSLASGGGYMVGNWDFISKLIFNH